MLLIATADSVLALDTQTGEEVWRVETPVAFRCRAVGQENAVTIVGTYDRTLNLVAFLDLAEGLPVSALPSDLKVEAMVGEGSVVGLLLSSDIQDLCEGCPDSSVVEAEMLWDGEQFMALVAQRPTSPWATGEGPNPTTPGPALIAEDLATITLSVPLIPGLGRQEWVEATLEDYKAVLQGAEIVEMLDIGKDDIQAMEVNGEPYLAFPLSNYMATEMMSSLIGTVCAASIDKDVVCARRPEVGTGWLFAYNLAVEGDVVTYDLSTEVLNPSTGDPTAYMTKSQPFDGQGFTQVWRCPERDRGGVGG